MNSRIAVLVTGVVLATVPALAQFPEDALRFATPGIGVGARALGMGNAYTGIASDYSAIYWNPAGLGQQKFGEFSLGLSHLNGSDNGTFLGSNQSYTNNATSLNTLGFVFPVPVAKGSFVLGLGYTRQGNFTSGLSFDGFNTASSVIQSYAPDGALYPPDETFMERLYLAYADTATGRFNSPINGSLTQRGTVIEEGGLNNWSVAGAVEVARQVYAGLTLTYLSGSYRYDREYHEIDTRQVYQQLPFDFDELTLIETVHSDLSGTNAKFGMMYEDPNRFRLGFGVKTPTSFRVKEDFSTNGTSYFDNGDSFNDLSEGSGEYDVNTPWVFSAGASLVLNDLVLAGDVEYTDWTQLEFDNANPDLIAKNRDIKNLFRGVANWRIGAEYELPRSGIRIRGGFIYNTSPFQNDPSSFDQKYATAGLGILLGGSTMLDVGYARGWWKTYRSNYSVPDGGPIVDEDITTNNFLMTLSFRY